MIRVPGFAGNAGFLVAMDRHFQTGFTLTEVLVAIVLLAVGVIALVGSSATTTRMLGQGKVQTRVAQLASARMEALRLAANSTALRCTHPSFASGGPVSHGRIIESWLVTPSGKLRNVQVNVTYRTPNGSRIETLRTMLECSP